MTKSSLKTSSPTEAASGAASVEFAHVSVLRQEVVEWFADAPAGWIVDCTAGGGGHSAALLASRPDLRVLALDRDLSAVAAATANLRPFGDRAVVVHTPFSALRVLVESRGLHPLSGIIADLGVSSHHVDTADRGFSFSKDGPLDMRMDPTSGRPLSELLARVSESELADVLYQYGDIRASRRAAATVLQAWRDGARTTTELAERLKRGLHRSGKLHPATLVFQALRIWVNDELGQLDRLLIDGPDLLAEGATMAVISFHSGEDRAVKRAFRDLARGKHAPFELLVKKPVIATDSERNSNPRARSAKLRGLRRKRIEETSGVD